MEGIVRVAAGPAGAVDETAVNLAAEAVRRDGAVIVTGAIDPAHLDRLAVAMAADLAQLLTRSERAENYARGHLQQDPPPVADFLSPAILAHPFVLGICRAALSQPVHLCGFTNNTNLPGSQPQAVHVDEGQLWPGLPVAHPPARLTVNIPLVTTDASLGAIELWPGTHLDTRVSRFSATAEEGHSRALQYIRAVKRANVTHQANRRVGLTVPDKVTAARRAQRPPVRATTEAGSVLIRDPRVWHRGAPNTSDVTRFMLALTYDPMWRVCQPVELPVSAQELIRGIGVEVRAVYVDHPIDHLGRYLPPTSSPLRRIPLEATEK